LQQNPVSFVSFDLNRPDASSHFCISVTLVYALRRFLTQNMPVLDRADHPLLQPRAMAMLHTVHVACLLSGVVAGRP
jgi:hypothetical protein